LSPPCSWPTRSFRFNGKHRIDGADKAETADDVTKRIIANPKSPITMDGVPDKIGGAGPLISIWLHFCLIGVHSLPMKTTQNPHHLRLTETVKGAG
jgi:hypothetical protein